MTVLSYSVATPLISDVSTTLKSHLQVLLDLINLINWIGCSLFLVKHIQGIFRRLIFIKFHLMVLILSLLIEVSRRLHHNLFLILL